MTPFEDKNKKAFEAATVSECYHSASELSRKIDECDMMIEDYRAVRCPDEREMLRAVAAEALKEKRECIDRLDALAKLLENHYGISA